MLDNLGLLFITALPLVGSPGPATLSLAAVGVAFGVSASLPHYAGIVIGTILVLIVVASGLAGLVFAVPGVAPVVTILALAYIVYLAVRIARAPPLSRDRPAGTRPSFTGALLLAISNPKAYAALGAVCSGVTVAPGSVIADAMVKVVALGVLVALVDIVWLGFGAVFASALGDPRISRAVNVGFAVLLVLSVAATLVI